jgi:hypothetical protein
MTFVEYLDDLVDKAQANVDEYEAFHDKRLADIRNMAPIDSFLYGVASGKLETLRNVRDLIVELMDRYDNP